MRNPEEYEYMRRYVVPFLLLVIFFIFPLQVFIIGTDTGIGIQGAVYRYQVTGYGNSLIPVTSEIMYIVKGNYTGKTALSVLLWVLGSVLMTITVWFGLVYAAVSRPDYHRKIGLGLAISCMFYLLSCIAQYGIFFHGSPGSSLPVGIGIILVWLGIFRFFPGILSDPA
jgi:hypothetical protein